jgi:hypothetical protein
VVAGCVLATLVLLEIVSRVVLVDASRDLRRFRSYPQMARDLGRSPALRVALVGNSATDRGVDAGLLAARLTGSLGQPLQAGTFVADASRINDWYHILDHYFWRPGVPADLFVVTFYENDIEDGNAIEIGRMARFFTGPADWPSVFEVDLPAIGDRLEFLLASGWASFALRSRIRERALGLAVPRYQPFAVALNEANANHLRRRTTGRAGPAGYRALDRLLAAARAHASRLVFVAYPTPVGYDIPGESARRIAGAGMTLIDLRGLAADLGPRRYADDVHLTPEGAALYSGRLADALAPLLARASPSSAVQADRLPALPQQPLDLGREAKGAQEGLVGVPR